VSRELANDPSPTPLLYTAEQAAALLQVNPSWLRKKATARTIPCTFVGKHLRFSHTDLEVIIASGARTPTDQHKR
jgi:excisionase family DNA binding protein